MDKIIIIIIAVGLVAYLFSVLTGSSHDEAAANGCITGMGCGYGIVQIIVAIGIISLAIMFVTWLFS
ncbi:MAG: hypothetical protein IJ581_04490 [Paludibacteraceae bacterium]|nr:hypothetical protein [Paludibacteraceae bacterium]